MTRILIVDDREKNRYLLQQMLANNEFEFEEASEGESALKMARARPPDLVITDVLMPGMDGFSLCKEWRQDAQLKHIPLIILTATFNTSKDEKLALDLGADMFINSPVEADILNNRIEQVLKLVKEGFPDRKSPKEHVPDKYLIDEHLRTFAAKLENKVQELERTNEELNATLHALKTAETRRDQLKSELEQFFILHSDLIFILDNELQILQVNPAWTELLNWEADTLQGRKITEFIHPDDQEGPGSNFREILQSGESRRFQLRFRKPDGTWSWIECNIKSYPDSRVFGIGRDISKQRESQKQLILRDIALRSAAIGVVITLKNGTIEWVNPAYCEITGYSEEELIGNTLKLVRSDKHDQAFYDAIWKQVEAGDTWQGETLSKRKNGELYYEETLITPVRNADGEFTHYIAFKEDISDRKRQEDRLMRSQRMESIGHLAGGMAHDLNNVLAPISLAIELLKKEETREDRIKMFDLMDKSCSRGAEIIRKVLTFARGIEGEQAAINIPHLFRDLESMIRETFPPDIEIQSEIPESTWEVMADPTQIHQVILNLAVNSRDAMPDGGILTLRAENISLENRLENFGLALKPGNYVRITVADTGIGIAEENLEHIFEPFFTTKEEGKGTGLGLPTVMGIIRSHQGLLEVESAENEGTQITFYLLKSGVDEPKIHTKVEPITQGRGETILVVDDEDAVLQISRAILEDAGYQFLGARDGAEGVSEYTRNQKDIALVISDIIMPVMNGAAMVASLKMINPEVKVIGSSGYTEDSGIDRVDQLRELGVNTILKKPYSSKTLLQAIADEIGSDF